MKFSSVYTSVLPIVAAAISLGSIQLGSSAASYTDDTAACLAPINTKRTGDLTVNPGALIVDDDAKAAVLAALKTDVDNSCADPSTDPSDYGFTYFKFASGASPIECSAAVNNWYMQITNLDCTFPPTNTSVLGTVDDFEVMMAEASTGLGCAKSSGCSQELIYCYYTPKTASDALQTFSKAIWDALIVRDTICAGSYYSKFAGVATTMLSFVLAWTYMGA